MANFTVNKYLLWLLAIAIMGGIYYCSSIPNLHIVPDSALPPWLKELINTTYIKVGRTGFFSYVLSLHPDFIMHKIGHIMAYGSLGITLYLATGRSSKAALSIVLLYAVSDEYHQGLVAGRSDRFGDILLDFLAAVVFILVLRRLLVKRSAQS